MYVIQADSDSGEKEEVELSNLSESELSDIEVSNLQCEIDLYRSLYCKINYNMLSILFAFD